MLTDPRCAEVIRGETSESFENDAGDLLILYEGRSPDGAGEFGCEYLPLDAVELVIAECEKKFDTLGLADIYAKDARRGFVDDAAQVAVFYLITSTAYRLRAALEYSLEDASLIARAYTIASASHDLEHGAGVKGIHGDARASIKAASKRAAADESRHVKELLETVPRIVAEAKRGPKQKVTTEGVRAILRDHGKVTKEKLIQLLYTDEKSADESVITKWAAKTPWKTWMKARAALLEEIENENG